MISKYCDIPFIHISTFATRNDKYNRTMFIILVQLASKIDFETKIRVDYYTKEFRVDWLPTINSSCSVPKDDSWMTENGSGSYEKITHKGNKTKKNYSKGTSHLSHSDNVFFSFRFIWFSLFKKYFLFCSILR